MTMLSHRPAALPARGIPARHRLNRLMTALRPARPVRPIGPARPTGTASSTDTAVRPVPRGLLPLTLHDGVRRLYALDARHFASTTSVEVVYDARVQTAYVLAEQGQRPEWLAEHLDLPRSAVEAIAGHAQRHGPTGPGDLPRRSWTTGS